LNETTNGPGNKTDTSQPTSCSPLKDIKQMADEMKGLKSNWEEQLLVAGIFGWPINEAEMAKAEYKIAKIPNPNSADTLHPEIWDYWPVCYDPTEMPKSKDTYDPKAVGIGANGGLRLAAFVDEFGADNGLKFSICETDFTKSMKVIGDAIAKRLQNLCVAYKLYDTDLEKDGLQPDCRVVYRTPTPNANDPNKIDMVESPHSLPRCPEGATSGNVDQDCWQLTINKEKCPDGLGQWINVLRTKDEIAAGPLTPGTKVGMQCRTCTDEIPNQDTESPAYKACHYNL
jgi:hypothetical protein